jgi:toxin ParE1/3/4
MLLFTPLAAQDLEDIADYIAQDNPVRALSFVAELQAQCQTIARQPMLYRLSSSNPRVLVGLQGHGSFVRFVLPSLGLGPGS